MILDPAALAIVTLNSCIVGSCCGSSIMPKVTRKEESYGRSTVLEYTLLSL